MSSSFMSMRTIRDVRCATSVYPLSSTRVISSVRLSLIMVALADSLFSCASCVCALPTDIGKGWRLVRSL
jgi:hypothetical protein